MDASARASYIKKMHEDTRHTIERQVQRLATKLNVNKQPMIFNIGDLVWLHLRKDRFPNERKSKLLPRTDGPFKVLARYNNNAYKIDLPRGKYNVSNIFNVKDLRHTMEMKISIRGRIFPKGGEMMRSTLRSSPWTLLRPHKLQADP